MGYKVAIAGVTGAVGREMLAVLERRNFPVDELIPLASARSAGKTVTFKGKQITVQELTENSFDGVDVALFSAGGSISKKFAGACVKAGCLMVDNSSAFRMDDNVPLVVPEVNPEAARNHQGIIANPNCTTIIMLAALAPLHNAVPIKRVVASTYQAASGAGQAAMDELADGTRAYLDGKDFEPQVLPHPYAFNLFPHNSPLMDNGYCEEEIKMVKETAKITGDPEFKVNATCIRVPVLRTHAEALNVEFRDAMSVERAYELLKVAPGITVFEDRANNRWAMPSDVAGKDDVYVGRIRIDPSQPNTLDIWVVGDQLLKGAALNAVQCAELALDCVPS
ncbi:MAG: aspartate-semialdehyde dehydrogenase [Planctomycetota bacterium]|jgi:aspartate-semialdehyde dehydrogenase|nr:aspartate-semialdehyde dehydrogenase [Planctomycetota bacterium]